MATVKQISKNVYRVSGVTPIHHKNRKFKDKLEIGQEVFISFCGKKAYRGFFKGYHQNKKDALLMAHILRNQYSNLVYADEIGLTPEEACINMVTF